VGSEGGVVEEHEIQPRGELRGGQRWKLPGAEQLLDGAPEALDDGDRAVPADGAKALLDAERAEGLSEDLGRELRPLVADEVARPTVGSDGAIEDTEDLGCRRLAGKDAGRERHPRAHIEHHDELVAHEAEEASDLGQVREPHVVGVPGAEHGSSCGRRRLGTRRPGAAPVPADSLPADLE